MLAGRTFMTTDIACHTTQFFMKSQCPYRAVRSALSGEIALSSIVTSFYKSSC